MKKSPFPCKVYHEHKFGGFPYESRQGVGFYFWSTFCIMDGNMSHEKDDPISAYPAGSLLQARTGARALQMCHIHLRLGHRFHQLQRVLSGTHFLLWQKDGLAVPRFHMGTGLHSLLGGVEGDQLGFIKVQKSPKVGAKFTQRAYFRKGQTSPQGEPVDA